MTLLASNREAAKHALALLREAAGDAPQGGVAAAERSYGQAAIEAMVLAIADMLDLDTDHALIAGVLERVVASQVTSYALTGTRGDVEASVRLVQRTLAAIERRCVDKIRNPPETGVVEYRGAAHGAGHA